MAKRYFTFNGKAINEPSGTGMVIKSSGIEVK